MKKAKTFAILGATALSLGILSTSIALYIGTPDQKVITIGGTYQEDGDYTVSTPTVSEGALNPDTDVTITSTLGFTKTEDSTYTQSVIVGKITVKIEFEDADFANSVTVSAEVDGYTYGNYFYTNNSLGTPTVSNKVVTASGIMPFTLDGDQSVVVTLSVADVSGTTFLNDVAEKDYTCTITVTEPADDEYRMAYLAGSTIGWNDINEAYMMVPSLDASDSAYTWKYEGYIPQEGEEFKARKLNDDGTEDIWSNGNNYVFYSENVLGYDSTKGITFRWGGTNNTGDGIKVSAAE